MKELTNKEKVKLLEDALKRFKSYYFPNKCMCACIANCCFITYRNTLCIKDIEVLFPEMKSFATNNGADITKIYWWERDIEGSNQRIKTFEDLINHYKSLI